MNGPYCATCRFCRGEYPLTTCVAGLEHRIGCGEGSYKGYKDAFEWEAGQ